MNPLVSAVIPTHKRPQLGPARRAQRIEPELSEYGSYCSN